MQFTATLTLLALVAFFGTAMSSPTPDEYHKEIGCFAYPATTRTPFCTPN